MCAAGLTGVHKRISEWLCVHAFMTGQHCLHMFKLN